jgi:WD40 repeat protein
MDRAARMFDAQTGRPLLEPLRHGEGGLVEDAQFSNDGKRIITASTDGKAQIWDAATGQRLTEPFLHEEPSVHIARFSPDGRWALTTISGNLFVWETTPSFESTPPWLAELAEAVGGWRLNDQSLVVPVDHRWESLGSLQARLSGDVKDTWARWATWILSRSDHRPRSPSASPPAK